MAREPGKCSDGHPCEVNGIFIRCPVCGWVDDSTLSDLMSSPGFVPAGEIIAKYRPSVSQEPVRAKLLGTIQTVRGVL